MPFDVVGEILRLRRAQDGCAGLALECADDGIRHCRNHAYMSSSKSAKKSKTHLCGAITEKGTPCQHPLTTQRWCGDHPGGRSKHAPAPTAPPVQLKSSPPPQVRRASPSKPRKVPTAGRIVEAKSAVELVREIATNGWRNTAVDRISSYIGNELWAQVDRSWHAKQCKKLAKAARSLSALEPDLATMGRVLGGRNVRSAVNGSVVASAIVSRVANLHSQVSTVVLALRLTGISLCELHGCIEDCQCLEDLADGTAPEMLKARIALICDDFLAGFLRHELPRRGCVASAPRPIAAPSSPDNQAVKIWSP